MFVVVKVFVVDMFCRPSSVFKGGVTTTVTSTVLRECAAFFGLNE